MLSNNKTVPLVKRFAGLVGYPRDTPEAVHTLAETLATATDEEHARRAVESLLYGAERCPSPADIRRAVNSTRAAEKPFGCQNCVEGWQLRWVLRTHQKAGWITENVQPENIAMLRHRIDWTTQVLYSGMVPCSCRAEMGVH